MINVNIVWENMRRFMTIHKQSQQKSALKNLKNQKPANNQIANSPKELDYVSSALAHQGLARQLFCLMRFDLLYREGARV